MNKPNNIKAFTLIEMLVAVGLLTAMLLISTVVFRTAIDAQQKASSAGNYMRDIRVVTQRIDDDFSQIDLNAPFALWFERNGSDSVIFFANGQFEQISGGNIDESVELNNYAALQYGVTDSQLLRYFEAVERFQDILAHGHNPQNDRNTLRNLMLTPNELEDKLSLSNRIERFKVQLLYGSSEGTIRWYPQNDPYANIVDDSDYDLNSDSFGLFFNIDAAGSADFYPPQDAEIRVIKSDGTLGTAINLSADYKPAAIKFTITLTDDGRLGDKVFTYVVKIGI